MKDDDVLDLIHSTKSEWSKEANEIRMLASYKKENTRDIIRYLEINYEDAVLSCRGNCTNRTTFVKNLPRRALYELSMTALKSENRDLYNRYSSGVYCKRTIMKYLNKKGIRSKYHEQIIAGIIYSILCISTCVIFKSRIFAGFDLDVLSSFILIYSMFSVIITLMVKDNYWSGNI